MESGAGVGGWHWAELRRSAMALACLTEAVDRASERPAQLPSRRRHSMNAVDLCSPRHTQVTPLMASSASLHSIQLTGALSSVTREANRSPSHSTLHVNGRKSMKRAQIHLGNDQGQPLKATTRRNGAVLTALLPFHGPCLPEPSAAFLHRCTTEEMHDGDVVQDRSAGQGKEEVQLLSVQWFVRLTIVSAEPTT